MHVFCYFLLITPDIEGIQVYDKADSMGDYISLYVMIYFLNKRLAFLPQLAPIGHIQQDSVNLSVILCWKIDFKMSNDGYCSFS